MVMAAVVVTAARSTYSSIGAGTICNDLSMWALTGRWVTIASGFTIVLGSST